MKENSHSLISDAEVAEERQRQLSEHSPPATAGSSIYDDLPLLGFDLSDEMLETLNQRFDLHN